MRAVNLKQAAQHIQALMRQNNDSITASAIVEDAQAQDSPLHHYFTWDDSEAAKQHRLNQARRLIRRVNVVIKNDRDKIFHVPAVHLERRSEGAYKPAHVIVGSISEFERAQAEILSHLAAAQRNADLLHRLAAEQGQDEKVAILSLIARALETAHSGLQKLH